MCFSDPEADTRVPDRSHALGAARQRHRGAQQHERGAGAQPEHVPLSDRGRDHGREPGTGGRVVQTAGADAGGRRGAGRPRDLIRRTASPPQPPYPAQRRRRPPAQDQLDGRAVGEAGQGLPVAPAEAETGGRGCCGRRNRGGRYLGLGPLTPAWRLRSGGSADL